MFLKSAFRAVLRRWPVAAGAAGGVFLLGLFFIPRPFTFTAEARLVLAPDRWTAGRALDFVQSSAVFDAAGRALGHDDGSDLRPGLVARAQKDAVELRFSAATRGRAIERVNAIGGAFETLSTAARRADNEAAMKRVTDALAERRRELEQMPATRGSMADRMARERLEALERAVETDRAEISAVSARMEILSRAIERNDAGPARPVRTEESDRLSAELEIARRQLDELRATYPEDWPPVVRASSRVEDLRARKAIAANREILEARFAPIREAIEELRGLSAKRDRAQQDLASHESELRPLRTRQQPADDDHQSLRARQEALTATIRDLEAVRSRITLERGGDAVIERFEPAGAAVLTGAPFALLVLLAAVLGLAAAFSAESFAVTIRTERDVRQYINLPLLSVVPHVADAAQRILPAAGPGVTEAFNTLAALLETRTKEDGSRLFAITSAVPSEGKSTVACNVAVALARAGSRVLLVDADLRRGTQHKLFSAASEPGLSAYLQGGTDTIDSMMAATDVDNLTLMAAGAPMQNPIPFLHAERFHALLRDLRGWYEYVIVDLPPVKSAADALIVAPLADAVLLVAAASQTRKDDVTYAKRMIRSVKSKLCGCVLTKARIPSGGYYYYPAAVAADAAE